MENVSEQQQPQPKSVRTEFQVYLTVSMDAFTTAEKFITMYYTYSGAEKYAGILQEFIKNNDGYYIESTLYGPEDIRVSIRRVMIEDNLPFYPMNKIGTIDMGTSDFKSELSDLLNRFGIDTQLNMRDDYVSELVIDLLESLSKVNYKQKVAENGNPCEECLNRDCGIRNTPLSVNSICGCNL